MVDYELPFKAQNKVLDVLRLGPWPCKMFVTCLHCCERTEQTVTIQQSNGRSGSTPHIETGPLEQQPGTVQLAQT